MLQPVIKTLFPALVLLMIPFGAGAQTASASGTDPVLILLASVAVVLAFVIFAIGAVLKYVLKFKFGNDAEKGNGPGKIKLMLILPVLFLWSDSVFAQGNATAEPATYTSMHPYVFYLFVALIAVELFTVILFSYAILGMLKEKKEQTAVSKRSLMEKLNASVPLEKEKDVMLDHDYDGIRELDNNLPPWWKYGFYLTIVFGVVYMIYYHITGSGKLQIAEYEEQITVANAEVEAFRKQAANLVDENNVTKLTDEAALASGQAVFKASCAACHGQAGEGGVGPNLTDEYWLHGGSVSDVFKSVKYGWPDKGMKSWQNDLGAKQIHEITSYILSLKGTNPPNAKEKQGELYEETPQGDSVEVAQPQAMK